MIGGDSKIVLTQTHNSHLETKKKRLTRQMGVGIKEKEKDFSSKLVSNFFSVSTNGLLMGDLKYTQMFPTNFTI
jgi:hypothetical protein